MDATCRGRRREILSESRMLGNPHVRFDERDVETGAMVGPLRHRQTKGAETDMPGLPPPRHIPTLPDPATQPSRRERLFLPLKLETLLAGSEPAELV